MCEKMSFKKDGDAAQKQLLPGEEDGEYIERENSSHGCFLPMSMNGLRDWMTESVAVVLCAHV